MPTFIAGHKLTSQQRTVLDLVIDHMRKHAGDSHMDNSHSPKGDGRFVPVEEIFPARDNHHHGLRRVVRRLAEMGILSACEIFLTSRGLHAEPAGWKGT